ncbi:serine/threonine-protein kinase [Acrocarpospora sp. B8E8]|uniref:serine/threonine-protein kinase n=1 Tax=Acrocarpospora sp. B8E8 TaxID=3153572 RepID=UPI00325C6AB9
MPVVREGQSDLVAGRYRLVRELGRGGMGAVWQAHDEVLGRDVALKRVLLPDHADRQEREQGARRILREARAAARLRHPSVIRIHDVVEDRQGPWIVMELLAAESLQQRITRTGPLPERQVARIAARLLDALRAAHAAGVVHRDIKPGNILLGEEDEVLLTDFGIAHPAGDPAITTSGVIVGSPAYLPPERLRGDSGDTAGDLWSLGATLFAAVEGQPPYNRAEPAAVLAAILTHDPDPMRHANLLRPLIQGLLRRDRRQRLSIEHALVLLAATGFEPATARWPGRGWPAAISGAAAVMTAVSAVLVAVLPISVPWTFLTAAMFLAGLTLLAPALPGLLPPVGPWQRRALLPRWGMAAASRAGSWQRRALLAGASIPLCGAVILSLFTALDLLGSLGPPLQAVITGTSLWLAFIGALTWRLSRIAAAALLFSATAYLSIALPGLSRLWFDIPQLPLPIGWRLAQLGAFAAAGWAGWIAYRLLRPPTRS